MSYEQSRKLINRLTIISTIVIIGLCIYWYQLGIFTSQAKMSAYLADKKILGPIIFVLIQIIQVVIPIIPGGVSFWPGSSSSALGPVLSTTISGSSSAP